MSTILSLTRVKSANILDEGPRIRASDELEGKDSDKPDEI
jgi:hypothetical protein